MAGVCGGKKNKGIHPFDQFFNYCAGKEHYARLSNEQEGGGVSFLLPDSPWKSSRGRIIYQGLVNFFCSCPQAKGYIPKDERERELAKKTVPAASCA